MATSHDPSMPIEYLATAKIGEKGQLTVPKEYREALALEAGAPIATLRLGRSLILIPEQARFRQLCDRIADSFVRYEIREEEILETLPEVRPTRFRPSLSRALCKEVSSRNPCGEMKHPPPEADEVRDSRQLIRHASDVPVLLSAIHSQPDWLLTHNTAHFTQAVAKRTGLRIATPQAFFQVLARSVVNPGGAESLSEIPGLLLPTTAV